MAFDTRVRLRQSPTYDIRIALSTLLSDDWIFADGYHSDGVGSLCRRPIHK